MEYPGKCLRAERENQNLSLTEVAKSTRIQLNILHAIEEGKEDLLPHSFYLRAFLTTYAKYLGLDPSNIIVPPDQKYLCNVSVSAPKPLEPKRRIRSSGKAGIRRRWIPLVLAVTPLFFLVAYYISDVSVEQVSRLLAEKPSIATRLTSIPSLGPTQAKSEGLSAIESIQEEASEPAVSKGSPLSFEIVEAALGKELETEGGFLKLKGTCAEFPCDHQKVYFLTRTRGKREGKLTHVWSRQGREFYRIEIEIKPPTRSVYSYLILHPHHRGDWTVEVREGDSVLDRLTFKATSPDTYS